jgi:hypothetical protein
LSSLLPPLERMCLPWYQSSIAKLPKFPSFPSLVLGFSLDLVESHGVLVQLPLSNNKYGIILLPFLLMGFNSKGSMCCCTCFHSYTIMFYKHSISNESYQILFP